MSTFYNAECIYKDTDIQPLVASSLGGEFSIKETGRVTFRSFVAVFIVYIKPYTFTTQIFRILKGLRFIA